MAPTPQEHVAKDEVGGDDLSGERVVISGMSGLYPDSANVQQFKELLYSKRNPITEENCRWTFSHPEVRNASGKIPGLDRFDAQFFKVHFKLGNNMDSMGRKILEQAYQAIYDAGVSPEHLYGKKVGVYTGSCFSETEKACFYVASSRTGFGIAGCSKTMFANRISYWLNAKGPSMSIDEACLSSMAALEQAYLAISRGECEAAIVGGAHLSLHPQSTVHCGRIIPLSADGKTRSFDQSADGCSKSEAINVLFLQKAKDAKRVYAEVLHVKTEYVGMVDTGSGPKYGFYRDPYAMTNFLENFYKEARVPPEAVEYVEAFGSGVPDADKVELEALEKVFCKDRSDPLLVGSVMSNIGYGEAPSGISAITKVLLGYQKGELAANLHCEQPRQDVAAVRDGRIQILTDHKKFGRSFTAINQVSVSGCNGHALLHGHYKPKDLNRYKASIPRLVTISARQDTAVQSILNDLKSRPIDPEEHALFHNIHETRISGHLGRGYIILDTDKEGKTVALSETSSYFDDAARPLWFVYSGMGSQWAGMGTQLMRIPVFAAAIERCRKALEPKGIDIVHIITSTDKTIFDNILHSFVGIAAIQIGLTDVLTALDIKPDMIIGHSVGELGCAYADGCFTAEEMILSAYSRGLVSVQTPFIKGSMAAVGIGYQQIVQLLPPEIEVACHNGPESCTISGPADKMKDFVAELTTKGIFAKEVPCSNIAYHSRYIADAGPGLLKYLSEVIKNPKPRSKRWVSSSVPQDRWDEPLAQYSSAEYHTNNLLNPVLFEETSRLIPANAVCIEIAPHALLQAILKRSLPESVKSIPMTRRGHADNTLMVLDAVGKLYMEGFNPKIMNIYTKVEFPVSTETPHLSHLIEWAHTEKWPVPLHQSARRKQASICKFVISPLDEEHKYLQGHVIRGKNLYPHSAALIAVWDTLAMSQNVDRKSISVEFKDLKFYGQPTLHERNCLRLSVALHRAKGSFEVLEEDRKVASGIIQDNLDEAARYYSIPIESAEVLDLTQEDVYQILHERDYYYTGDFRAIRKANKSLNKAELTWQDNWVTYLDGILQLLAMRDGHDTVSRLFQIRRLAINLEEHRNKLKKRHNVLNVDVSDVHNLTRSGGLILENVQFQKLPLLDEEPVSLKVIKFVPRFKAAIDTPSAIQVYLQIVAENINKETINVLGIMNNITEEWPVNEEFLKVLNDIPGLKVNYEQTSRDKVPMLRDQFLNEVDTVMVHDLSKDDDLCQMLYRVLRRDTYIINGEETVDERMRPSALFKVLSSQTSNNQKLDLVKWRPTNTDGQSTVVTCRSPSELTLLKGTRKVLPQKHKLVILATYPAPAGLKELVKEWRKESDRNQVYLLMISDKDYIDELPDLDFAYSALVNGIWGNEYYTSYQERVTIERGVTLKSSHIGHFNCLHWVEAAETSGSGIAVNVHYAAITDKDVKLASGVIPIGYNKEPSYGMDFSGVTDSGRRVMGLVAEGAASGRITARPELLWPVPESWSLEDAVTVPSAYAHAFYILSKKVDFTPGYKVLVHGATGALGMATIAIAIAYGCEVFATVGDVRKKKFLMRCFPTLKEEHIGNSRDTSFVDMIRCHTQNVGCNVVICNLQGRFKDVSFDCLSSSGILIDTALLPQRESYAFGMFYLTRERNYVTVDFTSMLQSATTEELKVIQRQVSEGIARGYVRPLPRVTYAPSEVSRAFKLLADSRHRGRVVLRLQDNVVDVEPRITCSPDNTHVVLCYDQSFGLQLAQRLVDRGANKLQLHCENPSKNLKLRVETWKNQGLEIQVSSEDLKVNKGIITLLSESNSMGPVEGIYVVATVAQNVDKITSIVDNLDLAARNLPSVRYFAVINSGTNIGQKESHARAIEGFPVTYLTIPALRKPDDSNQVKGTLSWRAALKAVERALRSSQATLSAHALRVAKPSLLQQIASIAEIEIPETSSDGTTLQDLGLDQSKIPLIECHLKDAHDVVLNENRIPNLTVQSIKELEKVIYGSEYPELSGLDMFYNYVDPDELLATTEIAFLPTLSSSASARDDQFDVNETFLCIIPGLEGHHHRFTALCERLKLPALILQPGLDDLHESLKDMAERYAKILLKKVCLKDNFYLLGYECGVTIALEVAAILEDHGLTGTVFCVGNTPEEFQEVIEQELSKLPTDEDIQNAVARHMYKLMTGNVYGLDQALSMSSWREKIEASCTYRQPQGTPSAIQVYLQTVAENINKETINVLGIMNNITEEWPVNEEFLKVLNDIPGLKVNYEQTSRDKVPMLRDQFLNEVDTVMVHDLSKDDDLCQMLYRVLRRDTYIINGEETVDERMHPSTLFKVLSSQTSNNQKLDLVKWRPTNTDGQSTVVTCRSPSELTLLKGTRKVLPQKHKLVILATYPAPAGIKELVKKWRKESDRNQVYLLMISDKDYIDELPDLDFAYSALVNGIWGNEYYTSYQERATIERGVTLKSSHIGHFNCLHWVEAAETSGSGIAVNVHYAAITDKDVKLASGVIPIGYNKEPSYGMDFSGVTDSGRRVMGLVAEGAASGRITARPELLWPVPDSWSLEDAVTVPSAYAHAFYILSKKVDFTPGYKVLVHGATGALGMATIAIAIAYGCEVFATVGDVRKKKFLMRCFPTLKEEHIGNSRDTSFVDMIRCHTQNVGCNVVICNLQGRFKDVSFDCLSSNGILIDTALLPQRESYAFGMFYLTRERSYVTVDFTSMLQSATTEELKVIQRQVSEGIARGYVRPLPRVTYAPSEVSRAFKLLADSRHRGRVVLRLQDNVVDVEPRITCSPDNTHVVLCYDQSFGLQLAQRLVDRGAKKLQLHCENPSKNLKLRVETWKNQGLEIQVSSEDLKVNKGIITLLSESNSMGPVEGIYVVATVAQNVDKITSIVDNLDLAARNLPSVRYFAVINSGTNIGQKESHARAIEGFPVTYLTIPALRKPDDSNQVKGTLSWRAALKAVERALRSSQATLSAHALRVAKPSLLQQIASIAEIEIPETSSDGTTLQDLGLDQSKIPLIECHLKDAHDVVFNENRIPNLTVQSIKELEKVIYGSEYPELSGLDMFYNYVDPDELLATTEIAFLPTLSSSASARDEEFDVNETFLCIIPGLEGHHHRFTALCERLKLPALILQPGLDDLHESLKDMAERYAKILLKKVCLKDNFYLLGYECGVTIALEVAAILEDHGLTGTVFCVGNTPEEFHEVLEQELSKLPTDEDIQNAVARHMYKLMTGNVYGLDQALSMSSWREKIEASVRLLLGKVPHSAQYARNLIETTYTRLRQAQSYKIQPRQLKSKLILLHASSLSTHVSPATSLQKYSQQPVVVHELKESLAHVTKDLRCSPIINSHLNAEILQTFEKKNLCESYLLNADQFMMKG